MVAGTLVGSEAPEDSNTDLVSSSANNGMPSERAAIHPGANFGRQANVACHVFDQPLAIAAFQPVEDHRGHAGTANPRCREFRSKGYDHHHG